MDKDLLFLLMTVVVIAAIIVGVLLVQYQTYRLDEKMKLVDYKNVDGEDIRRRMNSFSEAIDKELKEFQIYKKKVDTLTLRAGFKS